MRIAHVDSSLQLTRKEPQLERQSDSPPAPGARDELRAAKGILFAVASGMAFWVLVIWAIRLALR
jgi:hypothetical protein